MVGRVRGAVTRIEQICANPIYRVWCEAHQLDLAVHDAFDAIMRSSFQAPLHALIGHLRRQVNLKAEMQTLCLTVANTR